jgi:hypothetical protein
MSGQPAIIVDEISEWKATKKWSLDYLRSVFGHRKEFATVQRKVLSFDEFADRLETTSEPNVWAPQLSITGRGHGPFSSYTAYELKEEVEHPTLIDKQFLDEINFWIGRGSTPLHFDGYDNLIGVVRGVKEFLLLEPKWFEDLYIDNFQWGTANIANRDLSNFPRLSKVPDPIRVLLQEGEMLYLPAHWLHQVDVPQGYAITLNYWYRCQHGIPSSGFSAYFYSALQNMLQLFGDMNEVEKQDGIRRLRAVVDQLNEGSSPGSQKATTWSGGENVFSRFRI